MEYKLSFIEQHTSLPFHMESYTYTAPSHGCSHCHEFFEIGIVLEGSGRHYINDETFALTPGTVYLIPIGMSHALDIREHTVIENLYILPKIIVENLNISGAVYSLFQDFFLTCIIQNRSTPLHLRLPETHLDILRRQTALFHQDPGMLPSLLHAYQKNIFSNLLLLLCDVWIRPAISDKEIDSSRELRILQMICENIHTPVSQIIQKISQTLHLNPQYLNRLVKSAFHTTFSQLILETKLEKSCQLLEENSSITETALSLGFYDHSHYTRYFTRYFGISPSEYQKKYSRHIYKTP